MKLYLNKTSPYARLVLVTAHETGLVRQLETVWLEPWNDPAELLAVNPLAKVPTLITDEGVPIIESGCICEHLLSRAGQWQGLLPNSAQDREYTLQRLGLARAVVDCAFGVVIQRRFINAGPTTLSERWLRALPRAAAVLDNLYSGRNAVDPPDIGDIAAAVAFDYIDFRLPEIRWQTDAPQLFQFLEFMRKRPSMDLTRPQ